MFLWDWLTGMLSFLGNYILAISNNQKKITFESLTTVLSSKENLKTNFFF